MNIKQIIKHCQTDIKTVAMKIQDNPDYKLILVKGLCLYFSTDASDIISFNTDSIIEIKREHHTSFESTVTIVKLNLLCTKLGDKPDSKLLLLTNPKDYINRH